MPNATATEGESQENEGESLSHTRRRPVVRNRQTSQTAQEGSTAGDQPQAINRPPREEEEPRNALDERVRPMWNVTILSHGDFHEDEQINDLVLLGATAGISIAATSAYFVYSTGSIPDWVNEVLTATGTATLLVISAETALWFAQLPSLLNTTVTVERG